MRIIYSKWLFILIVTLAPWAGLNAQQGSDPNLYDFSITEGKATITQVFCIPGQCEEQQGEFTGTFKASFSNDQIALSDINTKSELDFTLPEDPHTDRNGSVYDARYYFDGQVLVLEGSIDSSAFDGPIIHYSLTAEVTDSVPVGFDQDGYFLARQDFRKCAAPLCGGIFVKQVNHKRLRCPDGRFRNECYVGTPDWSKLGVNPFGALPEPGFDSEVLLKGTIDYTIELGGFTAEKAYFAAGTREPSGTFYGVENNGIVCITSPCFSFDQYTLNSKKEVGRISDLDLTRTGASEKEITLAYELMAEGETVLMAGVNRRVRQFAGIGVKLVVSQFYLPIKADLPNECEDGYKMTENGCATANGCVYPLLELATYGGVRPDERIIAPSEPISYECVATCEEPAQPVSNGYCALYLP